MINFFHKVDSETYQLVCSKLSTEFSIISKPDVYLSKKIQKILKIESTKEKIREKTETGNSLKNLTEILELQCKKE